MIFAESCKVSLFFVSEWGKNGEILPGPPRYKNSPKRLEKFDLTSPVMDPVLISERSLNEPERDATQPRLGPLYSKEVLTTISDWREAAQPGFGEISASEAVSECRTPAKSLHRFFISAKVLLGLLSNHEASDLV